MVSPSVAEFCQATFGIELNDADAREHIALSIADLGRLHFEDHGGELLIYLARDVVPGDDRLRLQRGALRAVHEQHVGAQPVQVGMRGNELVFVARLDAREAARNDLEDTVELLAELQAQARE